MRCSEESTLGRSKSTGSLSGTITKSEDVGQQARATWQAGISPEKSSPGQNSWQRRNLVEKQEKLDSQRQQDHKNIAEKVEFHKRLREERFDRLMNETFRPSRPVYETAMTLREHIMHEEQRKRDLHAMWEEKVYEPIKAQIEHHMNPADRTMQASVSSSRGYIPPKTQQSVSDGFRVQVHREDDPTWREVSDHTWEETFDREATAILEGWSTSSNLRASTLEDPSRGLSPAAARSRPVLDPTMWGQLKLQGTLFGRFAQVVEEGPNARMGKRGGPTICAPDESDGVPSAGKRSIRAGPRSIRHNDTGMLRGDGTAWNGQGSLRKTWHGASSVAPLQDHYTYETGARVTDVEFPLGKRTFPNFP